MTEEKDFTYKIIEQPDTEMYWGGNGHIVIKQQLQYDGDQIILINPHLLDSLIKTLKFMKKEFNNENL